jgi:hypothetical protein
MKGKEDKTFGVKDSIAFEEEVHDLMIKIMRFAANKKKGRLVTGKALHNAYHAYVGTGH